MFDHTPCVGTETSSQTGMVFRSRPRHVPINKLPSIGLVILLSPKTRVPLSPRPNGVLNMPCRQPVSAIHKLVWLMISTNARITIGKTTCAFSKKIHTISCGFSIRLLAIQSQSADVHSLVPVRQAYRFCESERRCTTLVPPKLHDPARKHASAPQPNAVQQAENVARSGGSASSVQFPDVLVCCRALSSISRGRKRHVSLSTMAASLMKGKSL